MRKKLVSVLLVAAMGVSVLAGCGSSSGNEGDRKLPVMKMFWSFIMDIIRMKVNGRQHR